MKKTLIIVFVLVFILLPGVFSVTYYVKADGNDDLDGLSDATAWKSPSKIGGLGYTTFFNDGDDIYFKAGDEFNQRLRILWTGTENNRVIVGSYYMENGEEKIGIPPSGERPTFRGNFEGKSDINKVNTNEGIPINYNTAMIEIGFGGNPKQISYATVENFRVINAAAVGIGTTTQNQGGINNIIRNNHVRHTAGACIIMDGIDGVIEGNDVGQCDPKQHYDSSRFNDGHNCMLAHGKRAVIQNNILRGCFYEGLGSYKNAGYNIFRDNIVLGAKRIGAYMSESENNIVERNLIIGELDVQFIGDNGDTIDYQYGSGWPGTGMESNSEEHTASTGSRNNVFRNNIIVNYGACMKTATSDTSPNGKFSEGLFYGNTCVNIREAINRPGIFNHYFLDVQNNIFFESESIGQQDDCHLSGGHVFKTNYWEVRPFDNDCVGFNDIYGGFSFDRTSGWENFGIDSIPDLSDFYLSSNSNLRNKGTDLSNNRILDKNDYNDHPMNGNCVFDESANSYDFYCNSRDSTPDLGAIEYGSDPNTGGGYDGDFNFDNENPSSSSCHRIASGQSIPNGFGAPYDIDTNRLFFTGSCSSNSISLNIGSSDITYTYENSYYWKNNQWNLIKLNGENVGSSSWITGDSYVTVPIDASVDSYVLTYACKWTGSKWKCGCRDRSCNQNYWNLQVFKK